MQRAQGCGIAGINTNGSWPVSLVSEDGHTLHSPAAAAGWLLGWGRGGVCVYIHTSTASLWLPLSLPPSSLHYHQYLACHPFRDTSGVAISGPELPGMDTSILPSVHPWVPVNTEYLLEISYQRNANIQIQAKVLPNFPHESVKKGSWLFKVYTSLVPHAHAVR